MTSKTFHNPSRRDFLKTVGVASTVTAAACSVDPVSWDPLVPQELAYPYVIQPEAVVPGVASHYATRCNQCSSACGTVAKTREGRVIKLEGNTNDPFNKGKLCSIGQSAILENYSPDRVKTAQKGGAALANVGEVINPVAALLKGGAKALWIGRYRSGASAAVVEQFTSATGGRRIFWEPLGTESQKYAVDQVFGAGLNTVPTYNLENAKTIISFGADFLGTWGNPVKNQKGWADSRDPELVGKEISQTISVGPRIGLTGASSDVHLFCAAGTEAAVAFALAQKVAEKNGYAGPAKRLLTGFDAAKELGAAGVNMKAFDKVVARLASGSVAALPGGVEASMNESAVAIGALLLNVVSKALEGPKPTVVLGIENVANRGTGKEVVDALNAADGKTVLFLDDTDLVFQLGKTLDVAGALKKFGAVVHFVNDPNDSISSEANCFVVPKGTSLETWGDAETFVGNYVLQQPAMRPQQGFDINSAEDVLLGIARTNGMMAVVAPPVVEEAPEGTVPVEEAPVVEGADAEQQEVAPAPVATPLPNLDAASFYTYLKQWWKSTIYEKMNGAGSDYERFWIDTLKKGGVFSSAQVAAKPAFALAALPSYTAAAGDTVLFPHPRLGAGAAANRSWLQEIPDPITTFSWGSWVEINPKTAESLKLTKPNGVSVVIDGTTLNMGWFGSPGIKEGTFAVVMGNGHTNTGRYAKYGANPVSALKLGFDASGALVYPATKASISPTQAKNTASHQNELVKSDTLTRNNRGVNHTVSIEDLGKGQEKLEERLSALKAKSPTLYANALKVEHPSIVPEHHLPVDSMAVRARHTTNTYNKAETLVDMYPEPDHPTYRLALSVDLNRCTGCGACEAACYAENNIPVVGPSEVYLGRRMGWIRISRYWESANAVKPEADAHGHGGHGEQKEYDDSIVDVRFQPVMCQHCSHAPCEGVCPVLATYHNLDGLNAMVYNRCVGTRYCANNCPYSARRFNFHTYRWPESFNMMLNPDVLAREMGVMEKCSFCVQRVRAFKDSKRDKYEFAAAQKIQPTDAQELSKLTACAQACPADALTFGNKNDEQSKVGKSFKDERGYLMLGELNNKPGVSYLARIVHTPSAIHGHGGGHGKAHGGEHKNDAHGGDHKEDHNKHH